MWHQNKFELADFGIAKKFILKNLPIYWDWYGYFWAYFLRNMNKAMLVLHAVSVSIPVTGKLHT